MMMKSWPRRELEEAEEVMDLDLEVEGGGGSEEVRWENFLPRGSLRVLLVEGDDSTRQIIAALLRKCNYKVDAVSDGKKGWEILKERPQSVDLVLAEVEVPSISGLGLLNMIMDHDVCKNIPVIMMSCHDSVNMVYKCMLKGAADFLVKPVRRNELRNLWQHVWRRNSLIDGRGGAIVHRDGNLAKRRHEDMSEKENHLSEHAPALKKNKECSEAGSDAESSCTRFNMEAESTCKQSTQEPNQTTHKAAMLGSEVKPFDLECKSNEQLVEEEHSCSLLETVNEDIKLTESIENNAISDTEENNCYHDTHPKEAIDLIGVMENQPEGAYWLRDNMANSNDPKVVLDKDVSPLLELSLRIYAGSGSEEERGECGILNHSDSSAFSQYNSRLSAAPFPVEVEEIFGTPTRWYDATANMNMEDISPGAGVPTQSGKAIKCSPLRVLPPPLPVKGVNFDLNSGYAPLMVPVFYPQSSAFPSWDNIPSTWREGIHKDPLHEHIDQSPESPILHYEQKQETSTEQRDEQVHVSSVGDSGSSGICNGPTNHLNDGGAGHFSDAINRPNSSNASKIGNGEVKQLTEMCRLSQREAALNKFRMKRKDRCFEKKVRYQSRKKLAEQRPRVKGQFVRHAQPEPNSVEV